MDNNSVDGDIEVICIFFFFQAEDGIRDYKVTGVRRVLFRSRALASAKSERRRIAMLFIDLDRFKNINDTLGHEAGDRLLQNRSEERRGGKECRSRWSPYH